MKGFLPRQNTPRWIIFLLDLSICVFSILLAHGLRFNFEIPPQALEYFYYSSPGFLFLRAVTFLIGKTYAGIIRYTSTEDAKRIFLTVTSGSAFMAVWNLVQEFVFDASFFLPFSILIIDYFVTTFLMISYRIAIKLFYLETRITGRGRSKVLIYGAGEMGLISKRTLDRDASNQFKIVGFLDDDPKKSGKKLEDITIHNTNKLPDLLANQDISELIIAIRNPSEKNKKKVIDQCLQFGVKVMRVPPVHQWINGDFSVRQIQQIKIEDLLEREPIKLDHESIHERFTGKRVLVTGAAGSIGSEIVNQVAFFEPDEIVLFDQAESPLHELSIHLSNKHPDLSFSLRVGSIRDKTRISHVFDEFSPQIVFHAAAYKHVPLMELNPEEAVLTNVLGSKNLVDLSIERGVDEFVLISTDKAVNPTSVMGASKRLSEIYARAIGKASETKFVITRFGNVLGSTGSVIPLFKKQIEEGGPLTITHPEVTRYFMTIPEAAQLVLEAGAMGKGGEIFLFDMGESVRIIDLARKMIKLSGLEPGIDIKIKVTGLRPGEKLYEELLTNEEDTIETHHPRIMIAKVQRFEKEKVEETIQRLEGSVYVQEKENLVKCIKDIVPEYKSNNSTFSDLDD